jgi:hypothetical protein
MGFQFGPFDITGSIVSFTGSFDTTGSITVQTGSITVLSGSLFASNFKYSKIYGDLEVPHVSGSRSYYGGVTTAYNTLPFGFGAGSGGGNTILLYPTASSPAPTYSTFTSINRNIKLIGYTMYSNILASDFPQYDGNFSSGAGPTVGYVSIGTAYLAPSATSGQVVSNELRSSQSGAYAPYSDEWSVVPGGTVSSPAQIGDYNTLYISDLSPLEISLAPTEYSPTYFTFLMSIGAKYPTKTYKFRFELILEDSGYPVF